MLSDATDDVIQLMAKDTAGRWRHLAKAKMVQQREFVEFQLNEPVQRLSAQFISGFITGSCRVSKVSKVWYACSVVWLGGDVVYSA